MAELSLTQDEAAARAALLEVQHYRLDFDLTGLAEGPELRTTSAITFSAVEGAQTFVDCLGEVTSAALNGRPLPPDAVADGRITLTGLAATNRLEVASVQRETGDGRGIHRSVDQADGQVYVWSSFEPDDARVMFACFDQPDLKATFGISVTAPAAWTVLSNSAPASVTEDGDSRRWVFADTPRLSTYLPVVNAGPLHEVRSVRGGYDLGLYSRASLAASLDRDAEELFDLTRRGLEFYGEQFGLAFPQHRYDQVFMPEFAGAMENYGCVTWSDSFVYREEPSYAERELRAVVLLHEMAHMWFGDLVTMRWWDDLWLNESFAEWACAWAATRTTGFVDVWAGMLASDKLLAYAADMAPTTHPIRQPIADTAVAAASFDAITYPKGAAVLKQLVAYVGEEAFVRGLRAYFARYAWGNTVLADLIAELERAGGRDLGGWVEGWLETAGTDRLTLERSGTGATLRATSPSPTGAPRAPLPHRLDIGVYLDQDDALVKVATIPVEVTGERTPLPPIPAGALVLVNDDDLTFASARPDPASLASMITEGGRLPTALSRTLTVATAWDLLFTGEVRADTFVRAVGAVLPYESADSVVEPVLDVVVEAADYWSASAQRDDLLAEVAEIAGQLLDHPAHRLAGVRALARTATTDEQLHELARFADTPDLRWRRLIRLAELGRLDPDELDATLAADDNPDAWAKPAQVRAALGDPAAKQQAWQAAFVDRSLPVSMVAELGTAFWRPGQDALLAPYRESYLDGLGGMGAYGMTWALTLSNALFPRSGGDQAYVDRLVAAAQAPEVSPLVSQRVRGRADRLRRMLVARGEPGSAA